MPKPTTYSDQTMMSLLVVVDFFFFLQQHVRYATNRATVNNTVIFTKSKRCSTSNYIMQNFCHKIKIEAEDEFFE